MNGQALGAGAGPAREPIISREKPTEEQLREYRHIRGLGNIGLLAFLQNNPTLDVNELTYYGEPLYSNIMFSGGIEADNPLVAEVLRRGPDPFLKDNYGKTALNIVLARYEQFYTAPVQRERFRKKVIVARKYQDDYVKKRDEYVKKHARNLRSLMLTAKDPLSSLPSDVQQKIKGYLTGVSGPNQVQMSKLRVKADLPGVPKQGGKRSRRRQHKSKKTLKRRHTSQKETSS